MINKSLADRLLRFYGRARAAAPFLLRRPLGYFFYITGKCNLNCHYCWQRDKSEVNAPFVDANRDVMTPEEWRIAARKLARGAFLGISGGEATLSPALEGIIEEARGKNPVTINTNAVSLTEDHARLLTSPGIKNISVSLDGFAESHDNSRNGRGLFDRVVANIGKINSERRKGKPALTIKTTLSNQNLGRLEEFAEYCQRELRADTLNLSFQKMSAHFQFSLVWSKDLPSLLRASSPEMYDYDPVLAERTISRLMAWRGRMQISLYPRITDSAQLSHFLKMRGQGVYQQCYQPYSMVVALPDGEVIPCLSLALGNLRDHEYDMDRVLQGERYRQFLGQMTEFDGGLPRACALCCFAAVAREPSAHESARV